MTPAPTNPSSSFQHTIYIAHNEVETGIEARALQHDLNDRYNSVVFTTPVRRDDPDAVAEACANIKAADVIVLLGSKLFGKRTCDMFSSHDELRYILQANTPIVLVHMCHRFKYWASQRILSTSRLHSCAWLAHTLPSSSSEARTTPPQQVLHTIEAAMARVTSCGSNPAPSAPTQPQPAAPTQLRPAAPTQLRPAAPTQPQPAAPTQLRPAAPTPSVVPKHCTVAPTLPTLYEEAETSSVGTSDDGNGADDKHAAKTRTDEGRDDSRACVRRLTSDAQEHMSCPEGATAALAALVACSIESPTSIVCCLARDQLAVNTVLGVMRAHPRVCELQRLGCRILDRVMSFLFSTRKQQHPREEQLDAGEDEHSMRCLLRERIPEPVLTAMWHHQGDDAIQAYGCRILRRLTRDPDMQHEPLVRAGAVSAIATAMHTHTRVPCIQRAACKVLTKLILRSDEGDALVREVVDLGILEALAEALQHHAMDAAVVGAACQFSQVLLQSLPSPSDTATLAASDSIGARALAKTAAALLTSAVELIDEGRHGPAAAHSHQQQQQKR
ncbi:hypothetical protein PTSG_06319 [Salpingoeca rosetta]|uniref:TIR domain-containing protein n=1 Tax=Salpingoeca rosetta (strain ATCC 50818 / BSB-021) TaxID=946362 RepID=F2UCK3_SALR5|nr:uncharacterized protein PTSG_06319 [Salpingoeca rosetta]EGD74310.1 hypothetical protein PTSG_06319 [Salpingoeca rosetta]|eukprot:XP_004993210.1 hypothetical protein PTSG_06319 [Salpingoeca rosetta]